MNTTEVVKTITQNIQSCTFLSVNSIIMLCICMNVSIQVLSMGWGLLRNRFTGYDSYIMQHQKDIVVELKFSKKKALLGSLLVVLGVGGAIITFRSYISCINGMSMLYALSNLTANSKGVDTSLLQSCISMSKLIMMFGILLSIVYVIIVIYAMAKQSGKYLDSGTISVSKKYPKTMSHFKYDKRAFNSVAVSDTVYLSSFKFKPITTNSVSILQNKTEYQIEDCLGVVKDEQEQLLLKDSILENKLVPFHYEVISHKDYQEIIEEINLLEYHSKKEDIGVMFVEDILEVLKSSEQMSQITFILENKQVQSISMLDSHKHTIKLVLQ